MGTGTTSTDMHWDQWRPSQIGCSLYVPIEDELREIACGDPIERLPPLG